MKLTTAQLKWLKHARSVGYDTTFTANTNQALLRLERLKLIERNPSTSGVYSQWRITEKGERVKLDEGEGKS